MKPDFNLLFAIDRSSKTPLFEQLCEVIRKLAHAGSLKQGTPLPATRPFAEDLGVSRSTVMTAYEQLVAEGYIEAHRGSGYRVCSTGAIELTLTKPADKHLEPEQVHALKPLAPSQPDMRLFPYRPWAKAVARVCRMQPETMLTGANSFGNFAFRQSIVNHVREWRGLEASPQQIIVTAGATDALNICFRTLVKTGQAIGLEDPGYRPILRFVSDQNHEPVFLNIDREGATLPEGDVSPRVVVLTPSHQYPLGGVMSPQRRWEYINWANKNDSWIIEDDYDSEFRYAGRPIPSMAGLDRLNRTIYIGTFSKIFSNSLRLGYLIVPNSLVGPIRRTMDSFGLKATLMPQQALSEFIDSGDFYRHLRRVRKIYSERRKYLVKELSKNFKYFGTVRDHPAGMQLVFHLVNTISDIEVAQRVREKGIFIEPLSVSMTRDLDYNGFVLGYCGFTQDEIDDALQGLHTELSKLNSIA